MTVQHFQVPLSQIGQRLDLVVASLAEISRSQAKLLITRRHVLVDGTPQKASYPVRNGEIVEVSPLLSRPMTATPEDIPLDILYEDDSLAAINKPPGMVVHPAPGQWHGTVVNALLSYWGWHVEEASLRPGIVHRLDKDTSGVLLVAKHRTALEALAEQFKSRQVRKTYRAVVVGCLPQQEGEISFPIGRHPHDRKKMSIHARKNRPAVSRYEILKSCRSVSLVQLFPKTGRTHQLRVHLAALNHPIIGDDLYGSRRMEKTLPAAIRHFPRQALHAKAIEFMHPQDHTVMTIQAPYPADFAGLLLELSSVWE